MDALKRWDEKPCIKCGQVDTGQTSEYPCEVCGLPFVHDNEICFTQPALTEGDAPRSPSASNLAAARVGASQRTLWWYPALRASKRRGELHIAIKELEQTRTNSK